MSPRANFLLRAAVVLIMAMFVGAPTPGYVSGCSSGGSSVDPQEYCRGYNERTCARDRVAGRLDEPGYQACVGQIPLMCSGFNFGPGCNPTQSTVDACFSALVDPMRVGTDDISLPECQAVCGGSGGGFEPEGI
ncbi:hypothetical protein [Sandaracinus amylolyticus]|uniref:Uncharacterized protein n=1 Tax=Sandaracinus amylolyticus TaxID=927083 RepID=A0A0F6YJD7_9BACT|nr:hypothetical protein [Sandaracinus amylolyticus]AKF06901.1 hypothetical protein DB32_004050 [Sandaracinus amylolyticus]